ncbi:hypothetical protein DL96DRAFT_1818119 [Flagelloscypha sp. PMI_526]|nr:hypothetical protein DL96DRAFT_1818119 [Flagelloscypha sp. PMI_526]
MILGLRGEIHASAGTAASLQATVDKAMFSSLSTDLFPEILQHLSQKDILACLQVNSSVNTVATPVLWSNVTFGGPPWGPLSAFSNSILHERHRNNWKHVKNVKVCKTIFGEGALKQLSSFLDASKNVTSLQIIGASGFADPSVIDNWKSVMDKNWLPLLYSSKLFSRIVHLSFHQLRDIPLLSVLTQCSQLRTLHLVSSTWIGKMGKDASWSGMQLERLTFNPRTEDYPLMLGADLGALVQAGRTDSSIRMLHYDPRLSRAVRHPGFLPQLEKFLGVAPLVCSSLQHLSLGNSIWVYIARFEHIPNKPQLLPLTNLPSLQSLSLTTALDLAFKSAGDTELNYFFRWLCRHLTESSLPASFTLVTLVLDARDGIISGEIGKEPLAHNLASLLISSQLRFQFILNTAHLPPETMDSEYLRCSHGLTLWGESLMEAEKMIVLRR